MPSPDLEFFFDPACPFCWITSKWVRVVQDEMDLDVRWSYISLMTLNAPYDDPDDPLARGHRMGRRAHRVIEAAARAHGRDVVGPLYEAIGNRTWEADAAAAGWDEVMDHLVAADLAGALVDVGLPAALAAAADDDTRDDVFDQHTNEALRRTGEDVGTPIITFDPDGDSPASFFGPVISEVPAPAESVAFYRAIEAAARVPSFSELKRTKRDAPRLPLLNDVA
jgi:hypothetical protein